MTGRPQGSRSSANPSDTPRTGNPSELAHAIAAMAPKLPEATAEDLRRLLARSVAMPSASEVREARLGLLVELISDGSGLVPPVEAYDALRARRAGAGERWPARSTLCDAYGGWLAAVKCAMRLHHDGGAARVPSSFKHARHRYPAYDRTDVTRAILDCRHSLGDWPTQWEYEGWARLCRQLARRSGKPDPRLPSLGPIRKLFGTWDRALAVSRRL